jgi:hypothetical protein
VPHGDAEVSRELKLEVSAHRRGRRFVWKVSHRLLYSSVTLAQLGEAAADDGSLSRVVLADLGQGAAAGGRPTGRIDGYARAAGARVADSAPDLTENRQLRQAPFHQIVLISSRFIGREKIGPSK